MNAVHGRGTNFVNMIDGPRYNVTGLDTLAWGNVSPRKTHRYWAHLVLAVVVVVWVCGVFFFELRVYIRVRQDFLTSAEHRLTASATTILVSSIPKKWLTYEALDGLYDVFPGGIRNIWINRNYNPLLDKINLRSKIRGNLESAETSLIKMCKKAQMKQAEKDEKKAARASGMKKPTKEEKQQRAQNADIEANRMAQGQGVSAGDRGEVAHTVEEAVQDADAQSHQVDPEAGEQIDDTQPIGFFKRGVGGGLATLRHGIGKGLGTVGSQFEKAGQTIAGGVRAAGQLDEELESTPGFVPMERKESPLAQRRPQIPNKNTGYEPDNNGLRILNTNNDDIHGHERDMEPIQSIPIRRGVAFDQSPAMSSPGTYQQQFDGAHSEASLHPTPSIATQTRFDEPKLRRKDGDSDNWLQFWRGPAVGYPSPNPHGFVEEDAFPLESKMSQHDESGTAQRQHQPGTWTKVIDTLKGFWKSNETIPEVKYPDAYNEDFADDGSSEPLWKKYIKESDRPHHRLSRFSWTPGFLPSLPLLSGSKVDTIYWCRKELARLNVEIREDQEDKDNETRYPLMNSAFIQFNHQVAAHMACQAVSYHIPKQMAPRDVEIAPSDVIWDNMSIKWWEAWLRTAIILGIVSGMVILWAFPVAGTALLGNLPQLIQDVPFLKFLDENAVIRKAINALAGVLPALGLAVLLAIVPPIFYALAELQGAKTLVMKELSVQNYYFFFLFVQVFLVVSIASGALDTLSQSLTNVTSIPETLATNLPKASNYFFSYMVLQAFGTSSGALLQYVTLILWFILPKVIDSTARDKFTRATTLQAVNWGTYFPTYTNFACIALIYSIVSPLILAFAVVTFSLYWICQRYCMLYIFKLHTDTGGLLYPRAINQTFTGLYVMELCMIGLFFLARDQDDNVACIPQAIIMIIVAALTVLYQILLNQSFGPLFRHLPITLEDDAVLRDEQFERMELERMAQTDQNLDDYDPSFTADQDSPTNLGKVEEGIPMQKLPQANGISDQSSKYNRFDPRKGINSASTWATKRTRAVAGIAGPDAMRERHRRRQRDLEKQQAELSGAFFSGNDELEDLSPHQRDALVKDAFRHSALRAKQVAVWIPRDDLGVSDDEIRRMEQFSSNLWTSNQGAGLDSKQRVLFQQNPPDFSEVEHIRL